MKHEIDFGEKNEALFRRLKQPKHNDGGMQAFAEAMQDALDRREIEQMWEKPDNTKAVVVAGLAGAVAGYFAVDAFRPSKYLNDNGKIYDWS